MIKEWYKHLLTTKEMTVAISFVINNNKLYSTISFTGGYPFTFKI